MKKMHKGFTLVELLIVVSIMGVLAASMSMATKDSTAKAKAHQIVSDFKTIASAVSLYIMDSTDEGPALSYFNNHSDDYIFGTKTANYKVESIDATSTTSSTKWKVTYQPTIAATVQAELAKISEDVALLGANAMRVR